MRQGQIAVVRGWRGVGVGIDGPADLVEAVAAQLPPFYTADETAAFRAELHQDGELVTLQLDDGLGLTASDGAELHRAAASRIELALVDRLPDLVAVHAGVVADDRGVIVIPGRSMAGKSTLVAELVACGCTYFSDEFALVDVDGLVHPYPRKMTLRGPAGRERRVPAPAASAGDPPRPARLVALLRHDAAGWQTAPLTAAALTMALIDNCVSVRRDPARALTALGALAERATGIEGTRGEAAEAAAHLLAR